MKSSSSSSRTGIGRAAAAWAAVMLAAAGCESGTKGSGQIRINTEPPGAAVTVNGVGADVSPTTVGRLQAGTYLIVAEKAGYMPARTSVSILDGSRTSVDLRLDPAFALVLVDSKPQGAEVDVDGAFRGRTPFFLVDLPQGAHRFAFRMAGHLPREVEEIIPDRIPRRVFTALPLNAGVLRVRSTPEGATVRLNGEDRGVTPCDLTDAPAGENTVELTLKGYVPFVEKVVVSAQETRDITGVLQAIPTTLQVVSIPEKARIYVNDQFRGESPIKLTDLPPGEHRLRAELSGFEVAARTVSLLDQSDAVEEFRLKKNSGKIVVVSDPPGAKVFLNGEEKGITSTPATGMVSDPFEIDRLPAGSYTVTLHKSGWSHTPKQVALAPNAVVDLHEKMVRRYVPDARIRVRGGSGEIVREGMRLRTADDGSIELQLATGTIIKINKTDIISIEPLRIAPSK